MEEQKDMNTVSADTEVKEAAAEEVLQAETPAAVPDAAQKAEKKKKKTGVAAGTFFRWFVRQEFGFSNAAGTHGEVTVKPEKPVEPNPENLDYDRITAKIRLLQKFFFPLRQLPAFAPRPINLVAFLHKRRVFPQQMLVFVFRFCRGNGKDELGRNQAIGREHLIQTQAFQKLTDGAFKQAVRFIDRQVTQRLDGGFRGFSFVRQILLKALGNPYVRVLLLAFLIP